jgi:hypothetical protein
MSPDLLERVWLRWDDDPPVFKADEVSRWPPEAMTRLVEWGLLREVSHAGSVACRECGSGAASVSWLRKPRTKINEPYSDCRKCGIEKVDPVRLRRWSIDPDSAMATVSRAACIRGPRSIIVEHHLWKLGRAVWCGRSREVFFARAVHRINLPQIAAALGSHPQAVIITPSDRTLNIWSAAMNRQIVPLTELFSCEAHGLVLNPDIIEAVIADRASVKPVIKAMPKRGSRLRGIEALTRLLKEHLRAARDHAFTTCEQSGEAELLPRPTQKLLAGQAGLTETAVSNCLRDDKATELRLLWELAGNLDRIMQYSDR